MARRSLCKFSRPCPYRFGACSQPVPLQIERGFPGSMSGLWFERTTIRPALRNSIASLCRVALSILRAADDSSLARCQIGASLMPPALPGRLPFPSVRARTSACYAAFLTSRFIAIIVSAICTAFNAAPLRRLSDTHQNDRPCSTVGSLRMRLTKTASSPALSSGVT
jgi:hypothetical protein